MLKLKWCLHLTVLCLLTNNIHFMKKCQCYSLSTQKSSKTTTDIKMSWQRKDKDRLLGCCIFTQTTYMNL